MPVVRDLISTVNRLTQPGSPTAATTPAPADSENAGEPDRYADAGSEPSLDEVLEDPIVQLMMRADGVEAAEIRRLFPLPPPPASVSAPEGAARAP